MIHYYPMDDMAGTAQFYLGEIDYQQKNYSNAVNAYNAVLEGFRGNAKAPAAQLRKGLALLQMNKEQAGITELRLLIRAASANPGGCAGAQQAEWDGREGFSEVRQNSEVFPSHKKSSG